MRLVCDVKVFGEDLQLPLTMEPWQALSAEGLCLIRLSLLAASKGEGVVLTVHQAAMAVAIGKGFRGAKAVNEAWVLAMRSRKEGAMSLVTAGTAYLAEFAADSTVGAKEKGTGGTEEGADPNP